MAHLSFLFLTPKGTFLFCFVFFDGYIFHCYLPGGIPLLVSVLECPLESNLAICGNKHTEGVIPDRIIFSMTVNARSSLKTNR